MTDQSRTPRVTFSCKMHAVEQAKGEAHCPYCEAADLRERLAKAREEARRLLDRVVGLIDEREKAEARCRELEADARRYRWLRENPSVFHPQFSAHNLTEWKSPQRLDAAIDAAIAREGESHE